MRWALCVLVVAALYAGCAVPAAVSGDITLVASHARVSEGWAYDGVGVRPAEGTASVAVNHRSDRGIVNATVLDGFNTWRIDWREFAEQPSKEFQDGGIVVDLVEHGDSGVGDALIPKVHLKAAGWGPARLYQNGVLVHDPSTGGEELAAHFMWIEGRVRDDQGRILNLSKAAPYDPANPSDAFVDPEGDELFIQLKSSDGNAFFLVFEFRDVKPR